MTKDELDTERQAIQREHEELQRQHHALHENPHDIPGHIEHTQRLRRHADRLLAFRDAVQQVNSIK